ncbi:unnamed protein product [Euphydryas editha]|uniref:Uncharacterized protein n=1 Tax=Euphydryas editha TaxID=104508 RepID=A0AAU9UIV3_EUPED|nr:unnamed protein product [Euphydryas editha]
MADLTSNKALINTPKKSIEDVKLYDVQMKMKLAEHIVKACMNNTIDRNDLTQNEFYKEAQNYAPSSKLLLSTIFEKINIKNKPKTFNDWFEERSWQNSEDTSSQFLDIPLRHCFIDHYLHMHSLPTYSSIIDYLKTNGININIKEIKKVLKAKGYKTMRFRLPQNNISIIAEDPEQRFNRMKYLYNIIHLREDRPHIVYIDEKILSDENRQANIVKENDEIAIMVAVSTEMGVISKKIQNATSNVAANSTNNVELIDNWIINNVLPHISLPSVIILENRKNNTGIQVPTIFSKKVEMINWLEDNDVPYSSEMHSAELYELIRRSKHKIPTERNKLDEVLKVNNHRVLRRPGRFQYLNLFDTLWNNLQTAFKESHTFTSFRDFITVSLSSIGVSEWKRLENMMITTEKKTYSDDKAVDHVIDKLFTYKESAILPNIYTYDCDEDIDEIKMAEIVKD